MRDFERRVGDRERRTGMDEDRLSVIVRFFCSPGPNGLENCESKAYRSGDWRIEREPGESEEDFQARAVKAVPRKTNAVTVLVQELA